MTSEPRLGWPSPRSTGTRLMASSSSRTALTGCRTMSVGPTPTMSSPATAAACTTALSTPTVIPTYCRSIGPPPLRHRVGCEKPRVWIDSVPHGERRPRSFIASVRCGVTDPSPRRDGSDVYFGAGVWCVRICAAYGLLSRYCTRPGTPRRFPPERFGCPHRSCLGRTPPGTARRIQSSDQIPRQTPVLRPTGTHRGTPARPVPPPAQAQRSRQRSRQHQRLLQRSQQRLVSSLVRLPLESVAPDVRRHRQYSLHPRRKP